MPTVATAMKWNPLRSDGAVQFPTSGVSEVGPGIYFTETTSNLNTSVRVRRNRASKRSFGVISEVRRDDEGPSCRPSSCRCPRPIPRSSGVVRSGTRRARRDRGSCRAASNPLACHAGGRGLSPVGSAAHSLIDGQSSKLVKFSLCFESTGCRVFAQAYFSSYLHGRITRNVEP